MSKYNSTNELKDMSDTRYVPLHSKSSILESNYFQDEEASPLINLEEDHKLNEGFTF